MARCLVILADGLRPDAITRLRMPHLYALAQNWTHAPHAVTVRPSVTVAALASLATGVSPATHGLVEPGLGFLARLGRLRPLARELARHRVRSQVFAGAPATRSKPVAWALATCAGVSQLLLHAGDARDVAFAALPWIDRDGLSFVYLPDCDRAGHAEGWMSPAYLAAAMRVDSAIGLLTREPGDALVMVVSDHGGGGVQDRDHDAPHILNDRIPLVLAGRGVRRFHALARQVSLLDVPPTILRWFGCPVPAAYEGASLDEAFTAVPEPDGEVVAA